MVWHTISQPLPPSLPSPPLSPLPPPPLPSPLSPPLSLPPPKVLTLASNERVPLTLSMRLIFEIGHVKAATPATVSRAGILYVNPSDLGWNP